MTTPILDAAYWTRDFAVTDGDVTRLSAFLRQSGQPEKAMSLLAQVVHHKLEQSSLELDTQQRHRSEAAAQKSLQDQRAQVYHQTGDYEPGERLLVAWRGSTPDDWRYDIGEVAKKEATSEPHYRWTIRLRFANGTERCYIAGADLAHPKALGLGWRLFDVQAEAERPIGQAVNEVLRVYGATLLPHLLGRLDEDNRFVHWADSCWLAEALPILPEDALDRATTYLWAQGSSATTDHLLKVLDLPTDEPHRWALNLTLAADERFENNGTEANPRWTGSLPDHLLRLGDGTLLDLSTPPDALWARYYELFRGSLPKEWANNSHVLAFGGRWLLDVLLIPLNGDDLSRVLGYLEKQGQAVSDVDILKELFGVTTRDNVFDRWRFTLSYRLHQKAQELGVEFVGAGQDWRWALEKAPIEKPERHRRLPGTEGLATVYVTADQVAGELTGDGEPLDVPAEECEEEWKPTRQTWEYVLTYYDWDNGVLPYNCQAREIIPPPGERQRQAAFQFVAEQVEHRPFEVTLYADPQAPWLHSMGLKNFFVGYLVPGARIWIDRTEEPVLYKIRYRAMSPRHRRLLFFEEQRVRPVIREVPVACEVDKTMLLAEGRYSNIKALDRLDLVDRRTAPKVLARVFELIGLKDESRGVYCARFDDLFPLLCITKPYSKAYVQQILYDRKNHPWFYSDEKRAPGWFVYDPKQVRVKAEGEQAPATPPRPSPARPAEGVWGEVAKLEGRELATLDREARFRVKGINEREVVLVLETGTEWKPPREQVERAWRELLRRGELPRTWIRDEISEYNAGYIAAILAALPGVTYQTEPIRLFYRPTGEPKPTPLPKPAFEVPDIGIRHVVSPIPFPAGELPEWLFDEPAWNRLFGEGQPSLWRPTWTREDLDEALMQLIADKEANRFVTPRQVVDFMVNLAQPKPGERVADTCCGTGIFLVKALRFVKEVYGADADLELYGADIYDKAVEATRLNLQANGARNFTVVRADSLRGQVGLFSQKYDLILGNPPFGGGQAQAFLRRWHDLLISDGRLVVNVPDGVLSSSGTISISTRSWLAENLEIELVTSLPRPNDYERYGTKSNVFYARHRQSQEHITILAQANDYGSLSAMLSITHKPD